ncbi:MAG: hypothetical protein IPP90_23705 [Gemmatimonadaceae bacterium]|nr:hypothetical protein [Gemmatimonadaceae bacterium]
MFLRLTPLAVAAALLRATTVPLNTRTSQQSLVECAQGMLTVTVATAHALDGELSAGEIAHETRNQIRRHSHHDAAAWAS